jgi:glycosyltransferase involved in cell wall biosynthesis
MRIVLWPTYYYPHIGGIESFVYALALQLKKMGHQVIVISNDEKISKYAVEEIQVYTFPFERTLFLFELERIKEILKEVEEILAAFAPDVVNVHGWMEGFCFFQTRVVEKKNIPLCLTIHGLLEQQYYRTKGCMKLWSIARAVNTVSHALIETLEEGKWSHPCLQVIYNGLPVPKEPVVPIPFQEPQLLMVGRLTDEKCFDIGFRALQRVRQKRPHLKMRLVGGGALDRDLRQLKQTLDLDSAIEMIHFVPHHEVDRFIDAASLVLIPSSYESFSLVALQSAMRERPVIASRVYGLKEVVVPDQTGWLIDPKSPSLLADAIDALLNDPAKMIAMGKAAWQRAVQLFSIERAAEDYLAMYEKVL